MTLGQVSKQLAPLAKDEGLLAEGAGEAKLGPRLLHLHMHLCVLLHTHTAHTHSTRCLTRSYLFIEGLVINSPVNRTGSLTSLRAIH